MKHVLVLHSYFPNQGWTRLANEGIMSTLHKEKDLAITVDIRYLDMRNDTSKTRLTDIKNDLHDEYPDSGDVDLLIIVDDLAFQFVNEKGNELFPDVPIVFCSAKNYKSVDYGNRPVTGVNESIGLVKNIRLAKQLLPKTTTALLLNSENLPTGKGHLAEFEEFPKEVDGVEIRLWKDHTKKSLLDALYDLPENSVLFYGITSFRDDRELDLIVNLHDFSFFTDNTDAAIFSHNYDLINSGIMGGYTIKAEDIGEETANMAIEYLKGTPIDKLPVKLVTSDHLTLNYNALKKYNIPMKNFNNKSILVNYSPSFWDQHKNIVISIVIIFIIQLIFIVILLEQRRALQKSHIELKLAQKSAEESNQMKKVFLANMNHEIRTPLNAIIGFSNLLYEENLNEKDKTKYLNLINENSENLLNIVGDLLDLSKIESGALELFPRKVNVDQLIKEIYDTSNMLKFEQEKTSLKFIQVEPDTEDKISIYTDPYRLKQILYNLVINAIKNTEEGEIKLGYELNGKDVKFFVENPGLHLNAKEKERVFEPFYHPLKAYNIFNNSLGTTLSLMYRLAKLLNGSLTVDDIPGDGTVFILSLPLTQNDSN
ncbi:ABC transporter substrate binding protein [Saccharicrinis sp. FJH62]|uniref:sensor histidine kinase n=1 Tax=Saccharicrinis sp. FJH62 TaxID=3344657 RepID=UPI0035D45350